MVNMNFAWLKRAVPRVGGRAKSGDNDKKAFTEPESIKIDALYNHHQIKRRKSFVVEADCIVQEGELAGRLAANDSSAKVGCVLKPSQDMREVMRSEAGQTWHKRASISSSSSSKYFSGASTRRNSCSSTRRTNSDWGHSDSSAFSGSGSGLRGFLRLEQALDSLEQIQEEMQDLKQVIEDAEQFHSTPDLQRAIAQLAAKKQAILREKLACIKFEGEDQHVFERLKSKLGQSLDRMKVDWSSGGLNLTSSSPAVRSSPAARHSSPNGRRSSITRSQTERTWARKPEQKSRVTFGGSMSAVPTEISLAPPSSASPKLPSALRSPSSAGSARNEPTPPQQAPPALTRTASVSIAPVPSSAAPTSAAPLRRASTSTSFSSSELPAKPLAPENPRGAYAKMANPYLNAPWMKPRPAPPAAPPKPEAAVSAPAQQIVPLVDIQQEYLSADEDHEASVEPEARPKLFVGNVSRGAGSGCRE